MFIATDIKICAPSWFCLQDLQDWISHQRCTNPGCQDALITKFGKGSPKICGFTSRNLLHVTLLAPRILRWLLDLVKFVHPSFTPIWNTTKDYKTWYSVIFTILDGRRMQRTRGRLCLPFYSVVGEMNIRHILLNIFRKSNEFFTLWTGINNASRSVLGWRVLLVTYLRLWQAGLVTDAVHASIQRGVLFLRSCCLNIARHEVVPRCAEWAPLLPSRRWSGLLHFPPISVVPGERSRHSILEWNTRSVLWVNCSHLRKYCTIQAVTGGTDQTSKECSLGQTIPI